MAAATLISLILLSLFSLLSPVSASPSSPQIIDIFYRPLPASSSQAAQLARVSYDPTTYQPSVLSYTPPVSKNDGLLRIGLFTDTAQRNWVGSLTSFAALNNSSSLNLYLGPENEVYSVSVSALSSIEVEKASSINVEIIRSTPAPTPHLNRPIVINEDGKGNEPEPEKTLIQ
ncbi:hypothetical protein LOY91_001584, partial [Ophidiomyces ophidiicola]